MSIYTWDAVPGSLRLRTGEIHLWRVDLDRHLSALPVLKDTLAPEEIARASQFRLGLDRDRYIVAHGALRTILARYLQSAPRDLLFQHSPQGKPELASRALHFNLSGSHDLALCAISRGQVGVDVERVRPGVEEDVCRWLSPTARGLLEALPGPVRRRAFFRAWTRMEAYSKARGEGLPLALETFDLFLDLSNPVPLRTPRAPGEEWQWRYHEFSPRTGYWAAVAARGGRCRVEYWKWQAREIGNLKHVDANQAQAKSGFRLQRISGR